MTGRLTVEPHNAFLSQTVVAELNTVSYRLLSRQLKVNVTTAKKMLHDFLTYQNGKAPNSVHATYLLTGLVKPAPPPKHKEAMFADADGDAPMESSPFDLLSQTPDDGPLRDKALEKRIVVTPQHLLEQTKSGFVKIHSVAVYTIQPGPGPLPDMGVLAGTAGDVLSQFAAEDPLAMREKYGTILNPGVKRREGRSLEQARKITTKPPPKIEPKLEPTIKTESSGAKSGDAPGLSSTRPKKTLMTSKPPPTRHAPKQQQKDAFAAWRSSATTNAKKPPINPPGVVAGASTIPEETKRTSTPPPEKMDTDSEAEFDPTPPQHDHKPPASAESLAATASALSKRKQREDELLRMMEMEDEAPPPPKKREPSIEPESSSAAAMKEEPTQEEEASVSGSGKRKVRKRVQKKVQSRDEDGYLVTTTEDVWEEVSEDEPPPKPKPKPVVAAPAKGKKGAAPAKGQGNLMSFFAKKQT